MLQIRKRDGTLQEFDLKKIENAISRAFAAEHTFFNDDIIHIDEDKDCEYYAGSTFKVVYKDGDDKMEATFDKYGCLTSEKGKSEGLEIDLKISWSK